MSKWHPTSVGQLVADAALEFGDGYRTKRSEHGLPGYRIIRVADVAENNINFDGPDFVSNDFGKAIGSKVGQSGDILLTTKGTVGRVAVMPDTTERVVYSPQLCYFRVRNSHVISPRFLRFWFSSPEFWSQAADRMNNTDMAAYINMADVRSLKVSLPNIETQRAIAEVLGALDDKIAANTKLAATAHALAAHIYDCFTSSLDSVPMSRVLSPVLGGTPPRSREDFWAGDQLWASAKDITGAEFSTVVDTDEKISCSAVEKTKAKPLPAGSVILTARGTVGAVARLAVPASFNQSCYGFVPGVVPPGVLYFSIVHATQRAKAIAHGSVFDTITMKTFDHLEFPDFEGDTMANTEAKIAPLLETITGAVLENHKLATTRDALLPQLMSGKLRVKDVESLVSVAI